MPTIVTDVLENVLAFKVVGLDQSSRQIDRFYARVEAEQGRKRHLAGLGDLIGQASADQADRLASRLDLIQRAERGVGIAATAGAAGLGVLVSKAAGFEQIKTGFTSLLGSEAAATAELRDLQQFAQRTPFNFGELARSSQLLLGAGTSASQLIPILNALGTATAASGKGQESLNRAVLATSQIITKGKLQGDELLQLAEAGIPLNDILKELGVSYDEVGRKGVTATQFTQALIKVMGQGRFAGALAAQSQTLAGAWSNLQDATDQLETSLGTGLLPVATQTVKVITSVVDAANKLPEPVKNAAGVVGGVLVAGAIGAWVWLKALEVQNTRLMYSMLKTAEAAEVEAASLGALGAKARTAGGGVGAGGAKPGVGPGGGGFFGGGGVRNVLASLGIELGAQWAQQALGETNWGGPDRSFGRFNTQIKNVGLRGAQGAGFGAFAGPAGAIPGALVGGIAGAIENLLHDTGVLRSGAKKSPEAEAQEKLAAELAKNTAATQQNTASRQAVVSTSEVALWRQLGARRVQQFSR